MEWWQFCKSFPSSSVTSPNVSERCKGSTEKDLESVPVVKVANTMAHNPTTNSCKAFCTHHKIWLKQFKFHNWIFVGEKTQDLLFTWSDQLHFPPPFHMDPALFLYSFLSHHSSDKILISQVYNMRVNWSSYHNGKPVPFASLARLSVANCWVWLTAPTQTILSANQVQNLGLTLMIFYCCIQLYWLCVH